MAASKLFKSILLAFILISNCLIVPAQDTTRVADQVKKTFVVIKNDGTEYTGPIISQDEREVLIETREIGRLYIPKHEIKSIRELTSADLRSGILPENNIFSSRYFLTTNGLRMRKGDSYALFNYWGPEIQYSVTDGFTLGAMSTWVAMPIIISAKTSFSASDNMHFGFGVLAGTLSWAKWNTGGILPYAAATIGNSRNNFSISAGYARVSSEGASAGAPLLSFGCLLRITDKVSFVGDSFIYMEKGSFAIIVPGIRVTRKPDRAFQIGFAAISAESKMIPIPVPMLSWFVKI
jgi:hypothetical protein